MESKTKRRKREVTKEDLERNIEEASRFQQGVLNGTWKPEIEVDVI